MCSKQHTSDRRATPSRARTVHHMGTQPPRPLRAGQEAFNQLASSDPEIAEEIRGTPFDPFYDDSRMPAFCERVAELRRDE